MLSYNYGGCGGWESYRSGTWEAMKEIRMERWEDYSKAHAFIYISNGYKLLFI